MRRDFLSRPKLDGLWLRLTFRDGDVQEAVMPNNLLHRRAVGFNLIPPETTQRIWVPREALTSVQVLGRDWRTRQCHQAPQSADEDQIGLFER